MEGIHELLTDIRWAIKDFNRRLERLDPTPSSGAAPMASVCQHPRLGQWTEHPNVCPDCKMEFPSPWRQENGPVEAEASPPVVPNLSKPWNYWVHWVEGEIIWTEKELAHLAVLLKAHEDKLPDRRG